MGVDAQAKVLGIATVTIKKAWNFFGYRKLSSITTRFLISGEHGFDENIMKRLGFNKEVHVSVLVWYALLDDETKKKVNNNAARDKRKYEKLKQIDVENEKGEMVNRAQLRNQLQYEKAKLIDVENEKGEMVTKAQLRSQLQYEKEKQEIVKNEKGEIVKNEKGEMVTKAQLQWEKRKQRSKEFIRDQRIHRPPSRLKKEKCSTCGREKSFGWAKVPDALWYVKNLFKENGLKVYPATIEYLTMMKRKYLSKEDNVCRNTDILCYACWKICEGSAERKMQKLL